MAGKNIISSHQWKPGLLILRAKGQRFSLATISMTLQLPIIEKIRKLEPKIIEILALGQMLNFSWDESTLVS